MVDFMYDRIKSPKMAPYPGTSSHRLKHFPKKINNFDKRLEVCKLICDANY